MGEIVSDEIGAADWETIGNEVRAEQVIDVRDINKNSLFIGFRMAKAWEKNKKSTSLEKLCNAILAFAAKTKAAAVPDAAAPAVQLRE